MVTYYVMRDHFPIIYACMTWLGITYLLIHVLCYAYTTIAMYIFLCMFDLLSIIYGCMIYDL